MNTFSSITDEKEKSRRIKANAYGPNCLFISDKRMNNDSSNTSLNVHAPSITAL